MKKPAKKTAARRSALTLKHLREIALSFPGAVEGTSYGKPAFLVGSKFFTRLRDEDDSVVLMVGSIDERDMLLESDPKLFHITEHYRNYPAILGRLKNLDAATLRAMLTPRWRHLAPRKLVKEHDAQQTNTQKKPR